MHSFTETVQFEQSFWLHILRDHCQFILDSLSPREKEEVKTAKCLRQLFKDIIRDSPHDLKASYKAAHKLRKFKLHLLRRLLTEEFAFNLTPTFINHMVNELDEYLRILCFLLKGKVPPPLHPLHHHLLWLPDASGHATGIEQRLDGVEKKLIEKSRMFTKHFNAFYLKAIELAGFLRTHLKRFPALSRFNREVELEIILFQKFLEEIEELSLSKKALSTIAPLLADHMYREECYYLHKLSQVSEVSPPPCSPRPV
ncbi:DUF2935 domain-containing protein [Lihuaxuella thermophila]|uniref:DUF2935 domain-containing protein n=1 Tax=Lihuaxuella thermophila TaxID=1173111 RepID=A0A1H8CDD9_9BACL|nr:DUF2935 domain-containing protein [Lihuaxuella thermophila]SEM92278.1 protein of unknown function [Lihuaxuella thermophila]